MCIINKDPIENVLKKEYDAFISLGSSCFAGMQFTFRDLRYCALPFDFLLNRSNNHIKIVNSCFLNRFSNFFLYDNLLELNVDERGNGSIIQYKDVATQFEFIHHFKKQKEEDYERLHTLFQKRINRLFNIMNEADKVLLLTDSGVGKHRKTIPPKDLIMLQKNCARLFPNTTVDILFTEFMQDKIDKNQENTDRITIKQYPPHITFIYTRKILDIFSFEYGETSIKTYTMYNGFRLTYKAYLIATKYQCEKDLN